MQAEAVKEAAVAVRRRTWVRTAVLCLAVAAGVLAVLAADLAVRGANAAAALYLLSHQARGLEDAADQGDLPAARSRLESVHHAFKTLDATLTATGWLRHTPGLDGYYRDADHAVSGGLLLSRGALRASGPFVPHAAGLGLEGEDGAHPPGQDRLATFARVLADAGPDLERALDDVDAGLAQLQQVRAESLPETFAGQPVRARFLEGQGRIEDAREHMDLARSLVHVLPDVLGVEESRRYLILLQNDKELRPTGGFLSAYTLIEFDQGRFDITLTDNLEYLGVEYFALPSTPELQAIFYPDRYSLLPAFDANLYPDFRVSMALFEEYYQRSNSPPVDGIIALDTKFVEEIIRWTGPITVPGYDEPFTAEPIQVNGRPVPQVVYELEHHTERNFTDHRTRKSILGDLADVLVDRIMAMPAAEWTDGAEVVWEQARRKHLLFYFHNPEAQRLVEEHGLGGTMAQTEGDYLQLVEANWGLTKGNLFVERQVEHTARLEADGAVTHTVTVHYENPAAADGWLNGTYRALVSLYVPRGAELVRLEGGSAMRGPNEGRTVFRVLTAPRPPFVVDELGKTRFTGIVAVPANGGRHTITFVYRVPPELVARMRAEGTYSLLIQRQPGTSTTHYVLDLFGTRQELDLVYDTTIQVPIS
ncbi:MAG TPA: DUF4012 domain-containing protein [Dehalococcoidia bacterium]